MGLDAGSHHWLHADAIHLAASLNEVTLVPLRGEVALTSDELATMTPMLSDHLAPSELTIRRTTASGWLIESLCDWSVETVVAEFAQEHDWNEVLPQGRDAGPMRRLMTELQMLLHEHPVNQRRLARGIPAANAIWFWGHGAIAQPSQAPRPAVCIGRSDYFRGLCRLQGWVHSNDISPEMLIELCSANARVVGVVEANSLVALEAQWLTPLVKALNQGHFARLQLSLDDWDLNIDRWQLKAFWRRDLPLTDWTHA